MTTKSNLGPDSKRKGLVMRQMLEPQQQMWDLVPSLVSPYCVMLGEPFPLWALGSPFVVSEVGQNEL